MCVAYASDERQEPCHRAAASRHVEFINIGCPGHQQESLGRTTSRDLWAGGAADQQVKIDWRRIRIDARVIHVVEPRSVVVDNRRIARNASATE